MTTENDDDRTMTARNTVGIPCPEIGVPERNTKSGRIFNPPDSLLRELEYLGIRTNELASEMRTPKQKAQFFELEQRFLSALISGNIRENMSSLEDIIEVMEGKFLLKDWCGFELKVMLESIIEFTLSYKSDYSVVVRRINGIFDEMEMVYLSGDY